MKNVIISIALLFGLSTFGFAQMAGQSGEPGKPIDKSPMQGAVTEGTPQGPPGQGGMMPTPQDAGDMMEMMKGMMGMMQKMMAMQQEMLKGMTPAQKKQMATNLSIMMKRMDSMMSQMGHMMGGMRAPAANSSAGSPAAEKASPPPPDKDEHGH
ncbi:MAG: hypothetical protein ACYC7J_17500 [Syntrophales bacterium]